MPHTRRTRRNSQANSQLSGSSNQTWPMTSRNYDRRISRLGDYDPYDMRDSWPECDRLSDNDGASDNSHSDYEDSYGDDEEETADYDECETGSDSIEDVPVYYSDIDEEEQFRRNQQEAERGRLQTLWCDYSQALTRAWDTNPELQTKEHYNRLQYIMNQSRIWAAVYGTDFAEAWRRTNEAYRNREYRYVAAIEAARRRYTGEDMERFGNPPEDSSDEESDPEPFHSRVRYRYEDEESDGYNWRNG